MAIELVPLFNVDVVLAEPIMIGEGPAGLRVIFEVESATLTGDRVRGTQKGHAGADWLTINGTVGSLDVRATFETDDGALLFTTYRGRTDVSGGPGAAPLYVSPIFETSDERYTWLNTVQAVGKGMLDGDRLSYEWYEVR